MMEMWNMNRETVESSNLKSVGYDPNTKILEIEFHHGGVYQYFDVPANVHSGLMSAPSKGSYHYQHIKNVYQYQKI